MPNNPWTPARVIIAAFALAITGLLAFCDNEPAAMTTCTADHSRDWCAAQIR